MNGMNGMNGHAVPPVLWQEARNADGRVYYYNTITKATQWTKPEDLMSPAEVGFLDVLYNSYTDSSSVPLRTSRGRNILLKGEESIGITLNPSRVRGKCQMSTRRRLPKILL
jgi:hypothetical protein